MALLILAGCEQAERAIGGALPSRKAIAELPYQGDRPDAPPLAGSETDTTAADITNNESQKGETPEPSGCGRFFARNARPGCSRDNFVLLLTLPARGLA